MPTIISTLVLACNNYKNKLGKNFIRSLKHSQKEKQTLYVVCSPLPWPIHMFNFIFFETRVTFEGHKGVKSCLGEQN